MRTIVSSADCGNRAKVGLAERVRCAADSVDVGKGDSAEIAAESYSSARAKAQQTMPSEKCFLEYLCSRKALMPNPLSVPCGLKISARRVGRGAALYRVNDPLTALFVVQSGAFKNVAVSREGCHKVIGFRLPGDTVGLEAVGEGRHLCTAIALEDSEVYAVSYAQLERLAGRVQPLYLSLLCALSGEAWRNHGHLLMVGSMDAKQRVKSFLLSLSRRYAAQRGDGVRFHLPMNRVDIGSYLGLAHETVSRAVSGLSQDGLIRVHGRAVELIGDHMGESDTGERGIFSRTPQGKTTFGDWRRHAKAHCEAKRV